MGRFLGLRFAPAQAIIFWAFSPLKFGLREIGFAISRAGEVFTRVQPGFEGGRNHRIENRGRVPVSQHQRSRASATASRIASGPSAGNETGFPSGITNVRLSLAHLRVTVRLSCLVTGVKTTRPPSSSTAYTCPGLAFGSLTRLRSSTVAVITRGISH
jgi:hypothetical protein